ncbi:hypothetical protein RB195_003795 [Necator americanus]
MRPRSSSFLQFITCLAYLFLVQAKKELVFVQALWRHGDRAPNSLPYPKDPYNESAWPRGWEQLTNIGITQMNELGRYFRKTYGSFVSPYHIPSQVYIRSSDSDRALTSAQAFLSGFYPAEGSFQWQKGNSWQPIPVHASTPGEPDLLLKPTSTDCKEYEELVEYDEKKLAKKYNAKYEKLFEKLEKETGIKNFSYYNINKVYNVNRELLNNMVEKQPAWVFKRWSKYGGRSTMEIISELRRIRRTTEFNSKKKSRFLGGYLLNNWIENAKKVANGTMKEPKKMLLYSAHDGTIMPLMYAMGVANDLLVPYASALIMEIYKDNDDYLVELLFRNESTRDPFRLSIPDCGKSCTVKKMAKNYKKMVLSSLEEQQSLCGTPMIDNERPTMEINHLIVLSYHGFLNEHRLIDYVKRMMYWQHDRPLQYLQCLNLHECLRYPSFRSDLISEMKAEYMEDEWSLPRLNSQHQESSYDTHYATVDDE